MVFRRASLSWKDAKGLFESGMGWCRFNQRALGRGREGVDVGICDQKLYRWRGNVDWGCELCEGVEADGESAAALSRGAFMP